MTAWQRMQRLPRGEQRAAQNALLSRYVREYLYPFSPFYRRLFDATWEQMNESARENDPPADSSS